MNALYPPSIVVDRGMALHKMIRLITFSLGGEVRKESFYILGVFKFYGK
jgi:hypothetical protein